MINRYFLQSFILVTAVLMLSGQQTSVSAQVKITEMDWSIDSPEIIEMTVSPAAKPNPIFMHRLTWLPHETSPGNAATVYLGSFGEGALRNPWDTATKKFGDEFYLWSSPGTPREEISIEKLRQASGLFDAYIEQHIARATKRRDCDWGLGLEDLTGNMVFGLRLNSLQETRSISRLLALQAKLAILESRFDDAADLMRMNYRLAKNVGQIKLLVAGLIGIAEFGITDNNMVDFIAAENSPNMYWAMTELPRPAVDLREAFRLECYSVLRMFPDIATAETASHTSEEWAQIVDRMVREMRSLVNLASPPLDPIEKLLPTALGLFGYAPAKKRLLKDGFDAKKLETMAVGQVLLIDANREYRKVAGDLESVQYLPLPQRLKEGRAMGDRLREIERNALNSFGQIVALMILPAVEQVTQAAGRTERDRDALRLIEVLRMHAAETGSLPKTLDEITVAPVPSNPLTGKPFQYQFDGQRSTIDLPRSDGPAYAKRYKITLR